MSKHIRMTTRAKKQTAADNWVGSDSKQNAKRISYPKRLTIDIDHDLHKRLKLYCLEQDVHISDFLRRLIEVSTIPSADDSTS